MYSVTKENGDLFCVILFFAVSFENIIPTYVSYGAYDNEISRDPFHKFEYSFFKQLINLDMDI